MAKIKSLAAMPYYVVLVYMIAGLLGAGYFHTRSFLVLDVLLYAAAFSCILRSGRIMLLPVHVLLLVFTAMYWISAVWAVDVEQAVLEAAKISSLLPLSLLFATLSPEQRDRVWSAWAWCGAALTLWGLVFGLFREGRLESTLGYANSYAVIAAAAIAAGWRAYQQSGYKRYWLACVVSSGGLLLSGSRAVIILAVIGVVLYIWITGQSKKIAILSALTAAAVLLGGGIALNVWGGEAAYREIAWNAPEFALRRIYWNDAVHLWRKHWQLGVGGGGWAVLYPSVFVKYAHQQYLQVALDTGILGGLTFIAMITSSLWAGLRRGHTGRSALLAIILFGIHIAFDIELAYPLIFGLFIMLLTGAEADGFSARPVRISRWTGAVTALPVVCAIVAFTWLTLGYNRLAGGESQMLRKDWHKAEQSLLGAEKMLPWSHETHYQLAALYSAIARDKGDAIYMDKAVQEMQTASDIIPENRNYKTMLKQVEKQQE
ncbi:hypothetical protein QW71_19175 [Paenibacillus sp. IHB B 3415]|uniref:O-antigen ligase family protein n=1 Tax=Paenibacillus sp. IHB B 3415 TaxID=867080 RepID=UPI000575C2AD|nr:O-antigen ligase family protein [Paenibacillus sp. IHB B 3415]KHL94182.1 hypothetical protein QW71_19175 [Paenibacillus sp. IHB B 3415]